MKIITPSFPFTSAPGTFKLPASVSFAWSARTGMADHFKTSGGHAHIRVGAVAGCSTVISSRATSPLRILTPRSRGPSVWAYTSSFGGGLVAGDQTRLGITVDPNATCFLGTQASTKI